MDFLYQIFSEDLIYALGWTVLHSLWQALAIGLLMAVGMLFLQDKAARVRYELAAMALFLVFIAALSTFLIYYETAKEVADFTTIHLQEDIVAMVAAETGMMTVSTVESYLQYFNQNIPLIVTAWFLGVCFFLLRLMGGLVYIQRLKFTHNKPASDFWTKRVQQISRQLKLRRTVKLVESSLATVPMVIGYFKPVILMPIGTINGLSHSEVNAILAHELAHVYRNDFIINIFLSVIEVLFYFNPAVWWIAANIRTERENCCDDVAIALCGNSLIYAKALLRLQELSRSAPGYAMAFAGPKHQLLHRIKRILKQPRTRSNMLEKFTATCLLMVTVVLFSIGANSYNYNKNIQQEFFADELQDLLTNGAVEEPSPLASLHAEQDTTPKSKKQRFIKKSDEGEIELEIEEGDISKLIIDGVTIPESELGEYNEMIDELISEMESVPNFDGLSQPLSPLHPISPMAPMAPMSPMSPPAAPCPPSPSCSPSPFKHQSFNFDFKNKKTITTQKQDDGQTRIVIQSNGEEPTEIVLNNGLEYIFIDGTRLQAGDTAVIIDEKCSNSALRQRGNLFGFYGSFDEEAMMEEANQALARANVDLDEMIAEMETRLEEMREYQEAIREESLQRHEENMERHRADMNVRREAIELDMAARREAIRAQADALRHANQITKEEREQLARELRESYDFDFEFNSDSDYEYDIDQERGMQFNDEVKTVMVQELLQDGLIKSAADFSFELTRKSFKVNGKKQAAQVAKKYLELYESVSGQKMHESGSIKIENKNGRSKGTFRSSGLFRFDDFNYYSYLFLLTPETASLIKPCPKRLEGLESLSFLITPIEFKPG